MVNAGRFVVQVILGILAIICILFGIIVLIDGASMALKDYRYVADAQAAGSLATARILLGLVALGLGGLILKGADGV